MLLIELVTLFLIALLDFNQKWVQCVINGYNCSSIQHPYAVVIHSGSICSGSLLTLSWILTSAICVDQEFIVQRKSFVVAGLGVGSPFQQFRTVHQGFVHPNFSPKRLTQKSPELRFDIGLLKLEFPFNQSKVVAAVELPKLGFTSRCVNGTVVGTGIQDFNGTTGDPKGFSLSCVDLTIVDTVTCQETWSTSVFDSSVFCTKSADGQKGICYGDAGGAFVCKGKAIGIVSMSLECGDSRSAATYTKIEEYLDSVGNITFRDSKQNRRDKFREIFVVVNGGRVLVTEVVLLIELVALSRLWNR